jgi:branched-subunit amino acid permease
MSGWPILDVAIGLAFVYLLLSTICSSLAEGIESQLRSRAKYLERGITTIFGDSGEAVQHFFVHLEATVRS